MVCRDGVQETQLPNLSEPQILSFDTTMEQNQGRVSSYFVLKTL